MVSSSMLFASVLAVAVLSVSARFEPYSSIAMRTAPCQAPCWSRRTLTSRRQASYKALSFLDDESVGNQQVTQCSVRNIPPLCFNSTLVVHKLNHYHTTRVERTLLETCCAAPFSASLRTCPLAHPLNPSNAESLAPLTVQLKLLVTLSRRVALGNFGPALPPELSRVPSWVPFFCWALL